MGRKSANVAHPKLSGRIGEPIEWMRMLALHELQEARRAESTSQGQIAVPRRTLRLSLCFFRLHVRPGVVSSSKVPDGGRERKAQKANQLCV